MVIKKLTRYLLPLLILFTLAAAPSANGDDLDATLARSAVKGYLTTLKLNPDARNNLIAFYLTDEAAAGNAAQSLQYHRISNYAIVDEDWLDNDTYQVNAALEGEGKLLLAGVQKTGARWKITALAWGDNAPSLTLTEGEENNPPPSMEEGVGEGENISPPQTAARATVLNLPVNLRSGPGLNYPVQSILREGENVDITGISGLGTWYQVARNGQIIGWITASPKYVSKSPATAELPPVMASSPSLSGKLILQGKSGEVFYLVNADFSPFPDGSKLRRLTAGIDPALSPDGSKVAFTRWGRACEGSVWVYNLKTEEEWPALGASKQAKSPTWSPDGTKLVFNYQNGGRLEMEYHCYRMRPDFTYPDLPHRAYDIKFKADGRLCFKLPPDPHWQLREVAISNGNFRELASDFYSFAPTWDPANDWRVVFTAGSAGLQQLDVNRNEYFPFGTPDLRDRGPVFSPDGSQVAVSYKQHQHWEIYTIDAQSGQRARLTPVSPLAEKAFNSAAPAWSPDGKQIAFVSDRNGQWEFWVMNSDGSNPHLLLPPDIAAQISVEYNGVDERLISWGK